MGKKGAIPSALIDFIAYATYILVIAAFFFLFTVKATARTTDVIENNFAQVNGEQFLIKYLSTNVEEFGQNMTMGEFITISYERDSYDLLQKKIDADFDRFKNSGICVVYLYLQSEGKAISSVSPLNPPDLAKPLLGTTSPCNSGSNYLITSQPVFLPRHSNKKICVSLATALTGKQVCGNE